MYLIKKFCMQNQRSPLHFIAEDLPNQLNNLRLEVGVGIVAVESFLLHEPAVFTELAPVLERFLDFLHFVTNPHSGANFSRTLLFLPLRVIVFLSLLDSEQVLITIFGNSVCVQTRPRAGLQPRGRRRLRLTEVHDPPESLRQFKLVSLQSGLGLGGLRFLQA